MSNLILFNKPYQVLSQFTSTDDKRTLADYIQRPGFYPAGRLDWDSEGLLLLTNNGALQARISNPEFHLPKAYLVQVEGQPDEAALTRLRQGITLKDGSTRPAKVKRIEAPDLWPRTPPVRYRKQIPDSWLELTITEGRNRQVRRMTAAIGHPTLRLVRTRIGNWSLDNLQPGDMRLEKVHMPTSSQANSKRKKAARAGWKRDSEKRNFNKR